MLGDFWVDVRPRLRKRSFSRLIGFIAALARVAAACSSDVSSRALPADEPGSADVGSTTSTANTTTAAPTTTTSPAQPSEFAGATTQVAVVGNPTIDFIAAITDEFFTELTAADPNNPGTTPRPGRPGVQFVGIPEFQQVATDCSAEFATAVEGWITIDDALDNCQAIAESRYE